MRVLPALFLFLFSLCGCASDNRPNIVLIMADDLGYECIGANGGEDYETPVLDRLATEGMRFSNCFANPLCTPSRVKIMTGMYGVRNYLRFGTLDRSQRTFAHALKEAGYATCIAGKWQLGMEVDSPRHFGFDQSCLWHHTRYSVKSDPLVDSRYSNPALEINGIPKDYVNGEFGPDVCADFICDFIESNKDRAFCVYYPMILPHVPFVPPPGTPDWDPKSPGSPASARDSKYFGDMVHHMDSLVGRIVAKLDETGLREKTIIIFTGDNGTPRGIVTNWNGKKIAGNKGQMDNSGSHVPLIVNYPTNIEVGAVSDELVDLTDILPTLCEVAGIPIPTDRPVDGVSFWSTLKGQPGRDKPWVYVWHSVSGRTDKVEVLVRNKTHLVRRMKPQGALEFYRCPAPYEEMAMSTNALSEEEYAIYENLSSVITKLDKTRSKALNLPTQD